MKKSDWVWFACGTILLLVACLLGRSERDGEWLDYGIGFSAGVVGHDGSGITESQRIGYLSGHYAFSDH